jgi:hypothetical protein
MQSKTKWFVKREKRDGLNIPSMKAWDSCHSLIYSKSGNINSYDAEWVGFFTNKEVAETVKLILESNNLT